MNRSGLKRHKLQAIFQNTFERRAASGLTVATVMTEAPFCVAPETSAGQLVKLFHEKRFRHFLVADGLRLAGVVSDRDVIRLFGVADTLESDYMDKVTAAELMSTDLVTIGPQTLLCDAVGLMVDHGINCLPVVEDGQAVGILTSTDVFLSLEQLLRSALLTPEPMLV